MRRILVSLITSASVVTSTLAFADGPSTVTTTVASPGSTAAATTVMPPTPPASTTATTQASVDVTATSAASFPSPTVQAETTHQSWINRPLLATGFTLLGGSYIASAIVAGESGNPNDKPNLYYPVAGPWMDLSQRGAGAGQKVLLAFDGVGQGLGALAIVTSFFLPESSKRHYFFMGSEKLQVAPTMMGAGYGVGAVGKF